MTAVWVVIAVFVAVNAIAVIAGYRHQTARRRHTNHKTGGPR